MTSTLIQMAVLIACGSGWRFLRPGGLDAEHTRRVLTSVVYYLLLPAMVLKVLWQADIGKHSFQFTQFGIACILVGIVSMWLYGKVARFDDKRLGALILAAAYPNVTFLGLPVLEQTFGIWARSVAIQMDLFSTAPMLFTVGILIARHYGEDRTNNKQSILLYLNAPPFWAAAVAVLLNINQVPLFDWLEGVLTRLSDGVVPLMLFALGLALNWQVVRLRNLPYIFPVIMIKLCLMPLFALWLSRHLEFQGATRTAAILEIAMPSMIFGIVFCDRYQLDSSLYAMAVTVTTVLSMLSLPFWFQLLN